MSNFVPCESELFKTIMNHLNEHAVIKQLVTGVYDQVQKQPSYPYLIVGETETTDKEYSTDLTEFVAITFHVYSQSVNSHETREILKYLEMILKENMELDGYKIEKVKKDSSTVFTDIDQFTKHGVLRLKFKVRHNTIY